MTKDFVLDLIRQGEGQTIEFKEKFPKSKDLAREFCAFANTNDGYILLGVKDNQTLVGINWSPEDDVKIINIGSNSCQPHIIPLVDKVMINDKQIVILTIPEGASKPYKANYVIYGRYASVSRPADRETEMRLLQNGGQIRFDSLPVKKALVDDLDIKKIDQYLSKRAPSIAAAKFEDKVEVLRKLGYITNGIGKLVPTNAGLLCFSDSPQKFLPQAVIKCAFFKGKSKTDYIIDRRRLKEDILTQLEQAEKFVLTNMKISRKREEVREDIPQYSLLAIKEAVVNALQHRDYFMEGNDIMLLMFEDRLEIENPGGLGGNLRDIQDIEKKRYTRNLLLDTYFYDIKIVEGLGTGIKKIKQECKRLGAKPPKFEADRNFFKVTFYPKFV